MISALNQVARQILTKPTNLFATKSALPVLTKTVLVVDDDDSVRGFVTLVVSALGYNVLQARDGREALSILLERKENQIDLLLTDLMMPSMSGKELAMRLWEHFPLQRVIFFSGYTEPMARRMWRLDNTVSFLQKPFSSHTLAARVRQALGENLSAASV